MTQTIAQQIKWDFKANNLLEIRDTNGNPIYWEDSDGVWIKYERNSQGNAIYYENSDGYWEKYEHDSQGKLIYYEESINGVIVDNRHKHCEGKIVEFEGEKYKLVKV